MKVKQFICTKCKFGKHPSYNAPLTGPGNYGRREDQGRVGIPRRENFLKGLGLNHPKIFHWLKPRLTPDRIPDLSSNPQDPRLILKSIDNTVHRRDISIIVEGSTDGDSNRACKAHGRRLETYIISTHKSQEVGRSIQFGPQNLEGINTPHDDALVIRATIANYNVARIFVDIDSLVNVLYKDALDQIQIDKDALMPMATSFFRLLGHEVQPLGQIYLPLSMGKEPLR